LCFLAIGLTAQTSPYCGTSVTHFAGDPGSEVLLTIENTGTNTLLISVESPDATNAVDALVIPGGSGAAINVTNPMPNLYTAELTWTGAPPAIVSLNVLWSKEFLPNGDPFGGLWQLMTNNFDVDFAATCAPIMSDCTSTAASCIDCPEAQVDIPMTAGDAFNDAGRFDGGGDPVFPNYDPTTNTGTLTIEAGSNSTFVVSGVNNIAIPADATNLCFTADVNAISGDYPFLLEFRIEQKDPVSGAEIARLVFDQNIDGTGICSIGGNISDGTASGPFVVDAANFTYALVWAIADFDGTAPTVDNVVEVSNVTLLACVPESCTAAAADFVPCGGDEFNIAMTDGDAFNDAGRFDGGGNPVFPDYDPATNTGTLTIEAGSNSTFVVSGVNNINIPVDVEELYFAADLNVISGDFPFALEFRIEQKDPHQYVL